MRDIVFFFTIYFYPIIKLIEIFIGNINLSYLAIPSLFIALIVGFDFSTSKDKLIIFLLFIISIVEYLFRLIYSDDYLLINYSAIYGLVTFITFYMLQCKINLQFFFKYTVIIGAIILFIEYYFVEKFKLVEVRDGFGVYRPQSIFINPNAASIAISLACFYFINTRERLRYLIIAGLAIILTGSKSGFLFFICALIYLSVSGSFLKVTILCLISSFIIISNDIRLRVFDVNTSIGSIQPRVEDIINLITYNYNYKFSPPDLGIFSSIYFSYLLLFSFILVILKFYSSNGFFLTLLLLSIMIATNGYYVIPACILFALVLNERIPDNRKYSPNLITYNKI